MSKPTSRNIEYLLKTYRNHVPGEKWTKRMITEENSKKSLKEKRQTAQLICQDLNITGETLQQVYYLIEYYNNFKQLHSKSSMEQIIGYLCFYIMRSHNSTVKLNRYKVFKSLKLNYEDYSIVVSNMLKIKQEKEYVKLIKKEEVFK